MIICGVENADLEMLRAGMRLVGMCEQSLASSVALLGELDLHEEELPVEDAAKISRLRHPCNQRDWHVNGDGIVTRPGDGGTVGRSHGVSWCVDGDDAPVAVPETRDWRKGFDVT